MTPHRRSTSAARRGGTADRTRPLPWRTDRSSTRQPARACTARAIAKHDAVGQVNGAIRGPARPGSVLRRPRPRDFDETHGPPTGEPNGNAGAAAAQRLLHRRRCCCCCYCPHGAPRHAGRARRRRRAASGSRRAASGSRRAAGGSRRQAASGPCRAASASSRAASASRRGGKRVATWKKMSQPGNTKIKKCHVKRSE